MQREKYTKLGDTPEKRREVDTRVRTGIRDLVAKRNKVAFLQTQAHWAAFAEKHADVAKEATDVISLVDGVQDVDRTEDKTKFIEGLTALETLASPNVVIGDKVLEDSTVVSWNWLDDFHGNPEDFEALQLHYHATLGKENGETLKAGVERAENLYMNMKKTYELYEESVEPGQFDNWLADEATKEGQGILDKYSTYKLDFRKSIMVIQFFSGYDAYRAEKGKMLKFAVREKADAWGCLLYIIYYILYYILCFISGPASP